MNTQMRPIQLKREGRILHYICPKCHEAITFRRRYQGKSLCLKCGQRLDWSPVEDLCIEVVQATDSDEAAWIAKEYYRTNEMKEEEWIDITDFRNSLRGRGVELYLIFGNRKNHGRFMRSYAREGLIHDG